jgi:hypothetical protein
MLSSSQAQSLLRQGPCPRNLYIPSALDNALPKIGAYKCRNEVNVFVSIECLRLGQKNLERCSSKRK